MRGEVKLESDLCEGMFGPAQMAVKVPDDELSKTDRNGPDVQT